MKRTMVNAFVLAVSCFALASCASYSDWQIEDWDVSYKHCQVKLDWDSGKVKCKWKVSLLGT